MAKTENELETLWSDIKASPAIAIVLIVVAGFIIYYIYKKNNSSTAATTTPTTSIPAQSPYYLINDIITPPAGVGPAGPQGPAGPAGPPGTTTTTTTNMLAGKTRPKLDSDKNAAGVGVYTAPGGTVSRYQPFDSAINVIGTTTNVNGVDYYPIQGGGYIRERDLVGFG